MSHIPAVYVSLQHVDDPQFVSTCALLLHMIECDASLRPQHVYGLTLQLWHFLIQTCVCVASMHMSPCMRFFVEAAAGSI